MAGSESAGERTPKWYGSKVWRMCQVFDGDTEALDLLARGDATGGRCCADQFGPLVWSIALRTCRDRSDAEDATQDVFMELCKSAGRYDPALSTPRAFVAMITRRRLIDRVRSQRRHKVGRVPLSDGILSVRSNAETSPVQDEEAKAAFAELQRLRPEQQSVIRLAVGESWTHERIAEHLQMPVGTVKTHLRRGLIAIRDALSRPHAGAAQEVQP